MGWVTGTPTWVVVILAGVLTVRSGMGIVVYWVKPAPYKIWFEG